MTYNLRSKKNQQRSPLSTIDPNQQQARKKRKKNEQPQKLEDKSSSTTPAGSIPPASLTIPFPLTTPTLQKANDKSSLSSSITPADSTISASLTAPTLQKSKDTSLSSTSTPSTSSSTPSTSSSTLSSSTTPSSSTSSTTPSKSTSKSSASTPSTSSPPPPPLLSFVLANIDNLPIRSRRYVTTDKNKLRLIRVNEVCYGLGIDFVNPVAIIQKFCKFGTTSLDDLTNRHRSGKLMFYGYTLTDGVSINFLFARFSTPHQLQVTTANFNS
ncbi:uncharacterized protein BX664DRAFT_375080 [Halteromyces radiatus]|uniref:uncharacterized protein n=1 Tax=Halteromyces radiatus TaxID=101107 RepID=UPI0022209E1A|nr:uncharacterized protein BX664DRAFT_375080 [Halteromyces radiatus]KAI8084588.1 hypothetical protein BX664DRAFT_375080 [Halteromyces radiatus]